MTIFVILLRKRKEKASANQQDAVLVEDKPPQYSREDHRIYNNVSKRPYKKTVYIARPFNLPDLIAKLIFKSDSIIQSEFDKQPTESPFAKRRTSLSSTSTI